jgi:hypothetical protein
MKAIHDPIRLRPVENADAGPKSSRATEFNRT